MTPYDGFDQLPWRTSSPGVESSHTSSPVFLSSAMRLGASGAGMFTCPSSTPWPVTVYRMSPTIPEHSAAAARLARLFYRDQPQRFEQVLWAAVMELPAELEEEALYQDFDEYQVNSETSLEYAFNRQLSLKLTVPVEWEEHSDTEYGGALRLKLLFNPDAVRPPTSRSRSSPNT